MKPLTKKELQKSIVDQIDELFTAADWDTFKSKLQHIMEQATFGHWDNHMKTHVLQRMHGDELRLLGDMSAKYLYGEKVATKKRTRDLKDTLAGTLQYSSLPGEPYRTEEWRDLIRYK